MAKKQLTIDSEFTVGEEKALDFILSFLAFSLFVYGLVQTIRNGLSEVNYSTIIYFMGLVLGVLFLRKGLSKRIYIRINKKGIFQDEELVTTWDKFLKATIEQGRPQKKNGSLLPTAKGTLAKIQDNFALVVEYIKESPTNGFRRRIPLTNTQNKSEEDVLEAVKFFWKASKGGLN